MSKLSLEEIFEQIAAVVFDYDGVIDPNSEKINIAAAVRTFTELGLPLSAEEIASVPGRSSKVFIPPFLRARGIGTDRDTELITKNRSNYDSIWADHAEAAPDLDIVLAHLHASLKMRLAIATTNRRGDFCTTVLTENTSTRSSPGWECRPPPRFREIMSRCRTCMGDW